MVFNACVGRTWKLKNVSNRIYGPQWKYDIRCYFFIAISEMAPTMYDQYIALPCLVECVLWFAVLGVSVLVMFIRFNVRCNADVRLQTANVTG